MDHGENMQGGRVEFKQKKETDRRKLERGTDLKNLPTAFSDFLLFTTLDIRSFVSRQVFVPLIMDEFEK